MNKLDHCQSGDLVSITGIVRDDEVNVDPEAQLKG